MADIISSVYYKKSVVPYSMYYNAYKSVFNPNYMINKMLEKITKFFETGMYSIECVRKLCYLYSFNEDIKDALIKALNTLNTKGVYSFDFKLEISQEKGANKRKLDDTVLLKYANTTFSFIPYTDISGRSVLFSKDGVMSSGELLRTIDIKSRTDTTIESGKFGGEPDNYYIEEIGFKKETDKSLNILLSTKSKSEKIASKLKVHNTDTKIKIINTTIKLGTNETTVKNGPVLEVGKVYKFRDLAGEGMVNTIELDVTNKNADKKSGDNPHVSVIIKTLSFVSNDTQNVVQNAQESDEDDDTNSYEDQDQDEGF